MCVCYMYNTFKISYKIVALFTENYPSEIQDLEGVQKNVLLKRTNIKKKKKTS